MTDSYIVAKNEFGENHIFHSTATPLKSCAKQKIRISICPYRNFVFLHSCKIIRRGTRQDFLSSPGNICPHCLDQLRRGFVVHRISNQQI